MNLFFWNNVLYFYIWLLKIKLFISEWSLLYIKIICNANIDKENEDKHQNMAKMRAKCKQ